MVASQEADQWVTSQRAHLSGPNNNAGRRHQFHVSFSMLRGAYYLPSICEDICHLNHRVVRIIEQFLP